MEQYNILIVEDDKEIRDGIEIFLKSQNYNVFKAADGIEGLQVIDREEIHLAIVDIMMPRMDGVTMTMKLRIPSGGRKKSRTFWKIRKSLLRCAPERDAQPRRTPRKWLPRERSCAIRKSVQKRRKKYLPVFPSSTTLTLWYNMRERILCHCAWALSAEPQKVATHPPEAP